MNRDQQIAEIGKSRGVMGMMDISVSGMSAQSEKLRILAELVAKMDTVQGSQDFTQPQVSFQENLDQSLLKYSDKTAGGVKATVVQEKIPLERVYDPTHPAADVNGYIYAPSISFSKTMTDWTLASKHFEANLNVYKIEQQMAQQLLDLGR